MTLGREISRKEQGKCDGTRPHPWPRKAPDACRKLDYSRPALSQKDIQILTCYLGPSLVLVPSLQKCICVGVEGEVNLGGDRNAHWLSCSGPQLLR